MNEIIEMYLCFILLDIICKIFWKNNVILNGLLILSHLVIGIWALSNCIFDWYIIIFFMFGLTVNTLAIYGSKTNHEYTQIL